MNDPYYDILHCVERLYNEYLKHKSLIVALDFDDTIYDFHKKGYTYTNTIELIKKCQDLNFHIVIFTGSEKEKYPLILEHCDKLGIKPCKINENAFPMPIGNNGKIYYNILLDDRAGLRESILILQMLIDKINTTTVKNEK
jgi:hydroxymethylpyrimidine pyrophosphatase-like HAD family hydrolase